MTTIDFDTFAVQVRPSPDTNDHAVQLLGDGDDLIARFWEDMIGLDPDDVLVEPCPLRPAPASRPATIARCSCGVIGCGSVEVMIHTADDKVLWSEGGRTLRFRAEQYEAELRRAQLDTSWESAERTAARLEVLVSVPGTHPTPEDLATATLRILMRDPGAWDNVSYFPQRAELGPPPLGGTGWKRGTR